MTAGARDHALPLSAERIVELLGNERTLPPGDFADFARVAHGIEALFHHEFMAVKQRLKHAWESVAPADGDGRGEANVVAAREGAGEVLRTLRRLLRRANFSEISAEEIVAALKRRSLFAVGVDLDLGDFEQLAAWRRAESVRRETVVTWFGLKRRTIDVPTFDRFCVFAHFKQPDHFAASRKRRKRLGVVPGGVALRLFQNVPRDDIEALFPGVQVRMKLFDRALLGVPAAAGAIHFLWLKVNALLTIGIATLVLVGLRKEKVAWQEATTALLTLGFLFLFAGRQWGRFLGRRDALHRRLAEHLQTCTLDTGVGVFLHLVDQAAEEESAEAILAYGFLLRDGTPVALAELDAEIEAWLQQKCGRSIDFEEDDALGKLERLQLVERDDEGRIAAVPLERALAEIQKRWQALIAVDRTSK